VLHLYCRRITVYPRLQFLTAACSVSDFRDGCFPLLLLSSCFLFAAFILLHAAACCLLLFTLQYQVYDFCGCFGGYSLMQFE